MMSFFSNLSPTLRAKFGLIQKTPLASSENSQGGTDKKKSNLKSLRKNLESPFQKMTPTNRVSSKSFAKDLNKGEASPKTSNLPASVCAEVKSPGFTSRLTSIVDEQEDQRQNTRFRRNFGLPVVNFRKQPLPKLSFSNTKKLPLNRRTSRTLHRPAVTVKIAPAEPYSPFRSSHFSSLDNQANEPVCIDETKSSDPQSVIAVLAELSRKRERNDDDDAGSKRARRDSSSSVGSSLSMEMPPLFTNGVIGQTTSQLLSRDPDVSLNTLLNGQSFATNGMMKQQQQQPQSSCHTKYNEINSSLSSSKKLLKAKRLREESSEESDDDSIISNAPKRSNIYRFDDKPTSCKKILTKKDEKLVSLPHQDTEFLESKVNKPQNQCSGQSEKSSQNLATNTFTLTKEKILSLPKMSEMAVYVDQNKLVPDKDKIKISSLKDVEEDKQRDNERLKNFLSVINPESIPELAKKSFKKIETPPNIEPKIFSNEEVSVSATFKLGIDKSGGLILNKSESKVSNITSTLTSSLVTVTDSGQESVSKTIQKSPIVSSLVKPENINKESDILATISKVSPSFGTVVSATVSLQNSNNTSAEMKINNQQSPIAESSQTDSASDKKDPVLFPVTSLVKETLDKSVDENILVTTSFSSAPVSTTATFTFGKLNSTTTTTPDLFSVEKSKLSSTANSTKIVSTNSTASSPVSVSNSIAATSVPSFLPSSATSLPFTFGSTATPASSNSSLAFNFNASVSTTVSINKSFDTNNSTLLNKTSENLISSNNVTSSVQTPNPSANPLQLSTAVVSPLQASNAVASLLTTSSIITSPLKTTSTVVSALKSNTIVTTSALSSVFSFGNSKPLTSGFPSFSGSGTSNSQASKSELPNSGFNINSLASPSGNFGAVPTSSAATLENRDIMKSPANTMSNKLSFGAGSTKISSSVDFKFGNVTQVTAASASSTTFTFGQGSSNPPSNFTFGSSVSVTKVDTFNDKTQSSDKNIFTFGSSNVQPTTTAQSTGFSFNFGQKATNLQEKPGGQPFVFGGNSIQSTTSSLSFEKASATPTFSFGQPAKTTTVASNVFTFGQSSGNTGNQSASGGFNFSAGNQNASFGSSTSQFPAPALEISTPGFNFSGTTPQSQFSFGSTQANQQTQQQQPSSVFQFGGAASNNQQNQNSGFKFNPAPTSFNFSSTNPTPTPLGNNFSFGSSAPNQQVPTFGAPQPSQSLSFGNVQTPSFGGAATGFGQPSPQGGGMFTVGSSSNTPRPNRPMARARRTRR